MAVAVPVSPSYFQFDQQVDQFYAVLRRPGRIAPALDGTHRLRRGGTDGSGKQPVPPKLRAALESAR